MKLPLALTRSDNLGPLCAASCCFLCEVTETSGCRGKHSQLFAFTFPISTFLPPSLQANCTHTASTTESFIGAAEDSSGFICLCSSRRYRPKCFHLLLLGETQTAVAVTFYFFCLVQKFLGGDTIFSFLPVDDDSSNRLNKNTVSAIIKLQPFLHTALSRQALRCNWIHKHDLKQLFY